MCLHAVSAARRGETKFHDPSQAIYLNSVLRHRTNMHKGSSGFLLGNIGNNVPANRLANGFVQDRASGNWRNSVLQGGDRQQPLMDINEIEKLKLATDQQVRLVVTL